MELTYKQRLFVAYYLGEAKGNAVEAARMAGYRWPLKVAHRLVGKSGISAAIESRLAKVAMLADEVLARLSEIASSDIGDFISVDPETGQWSFDIVGAKRAKRTRVIKKLKVSEFGVELELFNPLDALERLARYHRLYDEKPPADDGDDSPRIIIPGLDPEGQY